MTTDFYEDEKRLRQLRIKNLKKQDDLFGAIYAQELQEQMANSTAIVLNDRSQDLKNIISRQNNSYYDYDVAKDQALVFVRRLTGDSVLAKQIIDKMSLDSPDDVIFIVKNEKLISKELKKYNNLNGDDFINLISVMSKKDDNVFRAPPPPPIEVPADDADADADADAAADADDPATPEPAYEKVVTKSAQKKQQKQQKMDTVLAPFEDENGEYTDIKTILQNRGEFDDLTHKQRKELFNRFIKGGARGLNKNDDKEKSKSNGSVLKEDAFKEKMISRAMNHNPYGGASSSIKQTPSSVANFQYTPLGGAPVFKGNGMNHQVNYFNEVNNANKMPLRRIYGTGSDKSENVVEKTNKYKSHRVYFDKIYIDLNKLKDNTLYVKYIYRDVSVPKVRTQIISDDLKELIEYTIDNRYNKKLYNTLENTDKEIFKAVVKAFKLNIDIPKDPDEQEFKEKFKVLVASYYNSGSDNLEDIKKELLKYVRLGLATGRIPHQAGYSLLFELSS
jgi:hypothetical protein